MERAPDWRSTSRRRFLGTVGAAAVALGPLRAFADTTIRLPLPGGPDERTLVTSFPEKGAVILQRTRPPLLETPFEVFDQSLFTPNDRFYVRWHWADIPSTVDVHAFRLAVRGHVTRELQLSLDDVMALPRFELAAVNQCSGNSRGYFLPRVPGGEWSHGAMGNARWTGVALRDVLNRAGVIMSAVAWERTAVIRERATRQTIGCRHRSIDQIEPVAARSASACCMIRLMVGTQRPHRVPQPRDSYTSAALGAFAAPNVTRRMSVSLNRLQEQTIMEPN